MFPLANLAQRLVEQKRARAQALAAESKAGEDQLDRASDATDRSPEREGSPDDFQELRPQPKRSRTAEASARLAEQSLIGGL